MSSLIKKQKGKAKNLKQKSKPVVEQKSRQPSKQRLGHKSVHPSFDLSMLSVCKELVLAQHTMALTVDSDFDEEKKEEKVPRAVSVKPLLGLMGAARGPGGLQVRIKLALGSFIQTNSGLGKYQAFAYAGNKNLTFYNIAAAAEFTSLDVLFDEVFIHSVRIVAKPRNKYSGTYVNGTNPTFASSGLATVYFLPHNSPDYADSSSAYFNAAVAAQHKIVSLAENWTFTARNPTRFSRGADIGDQTTSNSSMGWMQFGSVGTKYGGFIGVMLPLATAVSGTASLYPESTFLADYVAYYDLSVRARA